MSNFRKFAAKHDLDGELYGPMPKKAEIGDEQDWEDTQADMRAMQFGDPEFLSSVVRVYGVDGNMLIEDKFETQFVDERGVDVAVRMLANKLITVAQEIGPGDWGSRASYYEIEIFDPKGENLPIPDRGGPTRVLTRKFPRPRFR